MEVDVGNRTRVLVADDHALVADGIAKLLRDDFELAGRVGDGRELVTAAGTLLPDVVVTDISMPRLNGIDALRELRQVAPRARLIVVTMHDSPYLAAEAIRAGASGFVLKQSAGADLIEAVHVVLEGREYISPSIRRDLVASLLAGRDGDPHARLTPRQRQVLQLVAEGHSMKQVAALLHVSRRTAESHKYLVMELLGVHSTAELVLHAIRLGLIAMDAFAGTPEDGPAFARRSAEQP